MYSLATPIVSDPLFLASLYRASTPGGGDGGIIEHPTPAADDTDDEKSPGVPKPASKPKPKPKKKPKPAPKPKPKPASKPKPKTKPKAKTAVKKKAPAKKKSKR